jgi:peptide/nickel transport system permease protein
VLQYVIRRTVAIALMLLAISIVSFLLFFAIPRDPARLTCGKNCTPALLKTNRHVLGYDKPIATQYFDFLKGFVAERKFPDDPQLEKTNPQNIVHCKAPCLGYSPHQGTTINNILGQAAPITLSIALGAFVLWVGVGVSFGVLSALRRGKIVDKVLLGVSLVGYSFPTFFIGLIILQIVTIKYNLLPQPDYVSPFHDPVGWASGMLGAWITLAAVYAALYIRLTRAKMLETMTEDYIRTARAKGLSRGRVIVKHGLRSALTPIVTIAGLDLASVLGGAAVTEVVFNLNGIGKIGVDAIRDLDLPVIVAVVLIAATAVVVLNFAVDLLYAVIDPRVRYT